MTARLVRRLAIGAGGHAPPFVAENAGRIAAHFESLRAVRPALFNGDVLMFRDVAIGDGVLRARAVRVKYAVLTAILDWRAAEAGLVNIFGAAAILSADGALLLGRMGAHTYDAGTLKFVAGTPDLGDLTPDDAVDLDGSIAREAAEETGLDVRQADALRGYVVVRDGLVLAVARAFRFPQEATVLKAGVERYLASLEEPELCEVLTVRGADDPALAECPHYVRAAATALMPPRAD